MFLKKTTPKTSTEDATQPYVTLKRDGWLTWSIALHTPGRYSSYYASDYYTAHGSKAHAEAKAARILADAKRKLAWQKNIITLR